MEHLNLAMETPVPRTTSHEQPFGPLRRTFPPEWVALLALALVFSAAAASAFVMPVIAGALVEGYGIRAQDIGFVLAGELSAIALGSFALFPLLRSWDARTMFAVLLAAFVAANLGCLHVSGVAGLVFLRLIAGVAEGTAQAMVISLCARMASPHRAFGFIYTAQAIILTAIFLAMPAITEAWGTRAAFSMLAFMGVAGLFLLPFARVRLASADAPSAATPQRTAWRLDFSLILTSWLLFQLGQSAVWAYAERIAVDIGISFAQANLVYAISSMATIGAASVAAWLVARIKISIVLVIAMLLSAISMLGFPLASGVWFYGVTSVVFCSALFFAFPSFGTLASRMDASGRLPGFLPTAQAVGMAIGPAVASVILGFSKSYLLLAALSAGMTVIGLIAALPTFRFDNAGRPTGSAEIDAISGAHG